VTRLDVSSELMKSLGPEAQRFRLKRATGTVRETLGVFLRTGGWTRLTSAGKRACRLIQLFLRGSICLQIRVGS
jgi:hypothetical protein